MQLPSLLSGRRRALLARLLAIGAGQAAAAAATALLVRRAFDDLVAEGLSVDSGALALAASGLLLAASVAAWLRVRERTDAERLGQDYIIAVRLTLFDRLSTLAPRALQTRSRGGVMLRFIGDLTALRQWVSMGLVRLCVASVATGGAIGALALINAHLALTVGLALALGAAASLALGARVRATVEETRRRRAYLAANVSEKIASMAVVQVFGQARRERRRIGRQSRRLRSAMVRRARLTGYLRAISEATGSLASAAVLLVGTFEVAAGAATPGTVVAAMAIVALLVTPLRDLGRVYEYWHGARVSRDKLQDFLDTPSLVVQSEQAKRLSRGPGLVEFRDVSVAPGLRGLSAVAAPGQVVAIVGPNGAGKSTLLSLAGRLLDPSEGQVLIDDQDLAEVKLASLRRAVGMVGPDLPLLRGTVEKNLRYRCPDADDAEMQRVSQLCGIDEVLAELRDGAQTRLSDGGANLSLGQRQRIALARALLGSPRLLLLDEADANLDSGAARTFEHVLHNYEGTILLVTHRADRLAAADVVWFVEDGRLVESGPPAQLLAADGPTARLFRRPLALAS